jgi:transposase
VHLVVDNYRTHKAPAVKNWLLAHPRFHLHFVPTYSSWLNVVERWFAEITRRMIRRGTFRTVPELERNSSPGSTSGTTTHGPSCG